MFFQIEDFKKEKCQPVFFFEMRSYMLQATDAKRHSSQHCENQLSSNVTWD